MATLVTRTATAWRRDKSLAFLALVALALGIGSATAMFTVVRAVLLNPLPYRDADRWVSLFGGSSNDPNDRSSLSQTDLFSYRDQTHSFDAFGIYRIGEDFDLTAPGQARHIEGIQISASLIPALGVAPVAGRVFVSSDGFDVALISHRIYESLGHGIIGRPVTLSGHAYTVVGAMPEWFRMPIIGLDSRDSRNDVWLPLPPPRDTATSMNLELFGAYARLKPGVTLSQARSVCLRVAANLQKQYHPEKPSYSASLLSLRTTMVKDIRPVLLLLLGAAMLLLLITCANVAGLLVSPVIGRARETAICIALGGGRGQLAVQYFLESLWISLAAAVLGLLFSALFLHVLLNLATDYLPRANTISINGGALLASLVLAFFTATVSALAPLWQAFGRRRMKY